MTAHEEVAVDPLRRFDATVAPQTQKLGRVSTRRAKEADDARHCLDIFAVPLLHAHSTSFVRRRPHEVTSHRGMAEAS